MKHLTSPTSTRISLLIIAASLAIVTGALSLSAYLSRSTPPLNKDFVVLADETFGLSFSTPNYDLEDQTVLIYPGDTITYDPSLTCGTIPCFVFVECTAGEGLIPNVNAAWTELSEGSNIFYYSGDEDGISVFPSETETTFINNVKIADNASMGYTYPLSLTAYAVQQKGFEGLSAADLYAKATTNPDNIISGE